MQLSLSSGRMRLALLAVTTALIFAIPVYSIAPPANDNFANAEVISGNGGTVQGTNVEATSETGEPLFNGTNRTVWYRWTAPANLSMTFEIALPVGTLNDSVMGVFTGTSVGSLTQVATWGDDINGPQNRKSRITFIATAGTVYRIQISGFNATTGTFLMFWEVNGAESYKQFNFDRNEGSTTSDFGVFRPSNGFWYVRPSGGGQDYVVQQWGSSSDALVPGDYDGDGSTDIAVWRASEGTFYILSSLTGTFNVTRWGLPTDFPVQGDFDGDDRADPTVWRPSDGTFYVLKSSAPGTFTAQQWGASNDFLACGDYDGDGKTDFGVRRSANGFGTYYILRSSDGGVIALQFGLTTDQTVPGDYDGDGKNDIAVYRQVAPRAFYVLRSSDGGFISYPWGIENDIPVPGNYAGLSSRSDFCVWRPSDAVLYCAADGGTGNFANIQWGQNGDRPIARSNVH